MSKIEDYTPPEIQRFMDWLEKETGVAPTVERIVARMGSTWKVTHANERVTYVRDYYAARKGFRTSENALFLNGERIPLRSSSEEYFKLFSGVEPEPDQTKRAQVPEIDVIDSDTWRPAAVEATFHTLRRKLPGVVVGRLKDQYVVQASGSRGTVQMYFVKVGNHWASDPREPLLLVSSEGEDLTWAAEGQIDKIFSLMTGDESEATPASIPIARPRSTPGVSNSVQVRKTTVIRN